jgi:hypothetical protein
MSKNDIDERSIYDIEPNCEVIGEPGEYDEFKKLGLTDVLYIWTGIDLRRKKIKRSNLL